MYRTKKRIEKRRYDIVFARSEAIAPFPRLYHVAQCLEEMGFSCLAVGWDRERMHPTFERRNNLDIIRFRFRGRYGSGLRNFVGLFLFNVALLFVFLRIRPRCIHTYDLDTVIPALLVRFFTRCKVIYDIADWYSDSRRVGPFKVLVDRLERWICKRADFVVLTHEKRIAQVGFEPKRWVTIYNVPEDVYGKDFLNKSPLEEAYFAYVGVLYPDRGLEQIVQAAVRANVRLVMAGFGPLESYCKEAAVNRPNIIFLRKVPYERALQIEGNAIAILALYDPTLRNNQLAAPNKLYEAMMLGRPLITTRGTLVGEVVEKEGIGITVTYGDVQELSQALSRLRNNPVESSEMGRRARKLYEMWYSFSSQCERLRKAYQELCPKLFAKCLKGEGGC